MTTVGYNIPLDLTIEILLRLPAKSLFRFRSVSKTWCFIICSRQFSDAFMSLSLSRPRLVLAFNNCDDNRLLFFSSPHQSYSFSSSLSSSSSMLVVKNNTLTMPEVRSDVHYISDMNSVRGFVCCKLRRRFVVCNPSTRQVIELGETSYDYKCCMYLGYDPNNDQYKVLRLKMPNCSEIPIEHSVCTLGGQTSSYSWRPIKSNILYYYCMYGGICIDGVVYYKAILEPRSHCKTVSSFDVRSEQLRLIKAPENFAGFLANYLGKLAVYDSSIDDGCFVLWVLDDVKNQVWSKRICVFPSFTRSMLRSLTLRFVGITAAGEVVYVPQCYSEPFELFCYHVEKKIERRVRVEGLKGASTEMSTCRLFYVRSETQEASVTSFNDVRRWLQDSLVISGCRSWFEFVLSWKQQRTFSFCCLTGTSIKSDKLPAS